MGFMRFVLPVIAVLGFAIAAPSSAREQPRVWVVPPKAVVGTGFPAGKVKVTVTVDSTKRVKVVRASRTGRFTARFAVTIAPSACRNVVVSVAGRLGTTAVKRYPANAQDCAQPGP